MAPERRAVIDVGTNSVKLLVAEMVEASLHPVLETSLQTRLGRGFYEDHRLRPEAIAQTAEAVARFAETARQHHATHLRVLATSAARDAVNRAELVTAIRRASGIEPEIISGDQEAEWAFCGVMSEPRFAGKKVMILDVGGGSTEFVIGQGRHPSFRQSFPMGSVRLLEKLRPADPPGLEDIAGCRDWLAKFFDHEIAPAIEASLGGAARHEVLLVGTGGTSTFLARLHLRLEDYDRGRIESAMLTCEQVREWLVHLWSLPLARRQQLPGLPANRADVILMGVAIFEAVMTRFQFPELLVSTRGLRFGALLAPSAGAARRLDTPAPPADSRATL
jgi:exopolyphosphatase/guanosine-5'-triphosphate,3'-diphosphate pyrophosphatase